MGTLYLVRHGQASLGADDYDCLSDLGRRQCLRLGEHLRDQGMRFDAALVGTLARQTGSLQHIAEGLGQPLQPISWPGLNEYDSQAVIGAIHPLPLARADSPEAVRQHFRLLREGLLQWMAGRTRPVGMPSHADFVAGVTSALDHVREHFDGNVLIVSSGGPISHAVGQVLGTPAAAIVELNLRMRNSSVTEFVFNRKRHSLLTFNTLPHLDHPDHRGLVTYA